MSRAATDGIAGVVFVAVLVLFLTIKFIGQFGPGIIDGTVAFPTSLIQSKINKLRVLIVRWFTASVKLQMKFADLPPTCSVEELHSSKAMHVRTLEELGGVRHDWEMSQDMLEDAKLETHDAQVRESQSVDEHHAKELPLPAGFELRGDVTQKHERGKVFCQVKAGGNKCGQIMAAAAPKYGPLLPAQALLRLAQRGGTRVFLARVKACPLFVQLFLI